ncbi:MAG: 4-hydroxy-3-methylbut-2-enyl diphosphate reductase [Proteobacteria bacterium]|nr:4-hydroxy-3-methylbut-2-enyl diphosphate reductase [Pseudomonadota bacterium]
MEILVAKSAGFCYGVKRAIKMAKDTIEKSKVNCFSLGPIIHNPIVVRDLEKEGLKVIENVRDIKKGTLVIRSHGISKDESEYLKKNPKISVVDTTCPFVTKSKKFLVRLIRGGYNIFFLGDKDHPEVKGLLSYINNRAVVFKDPDELEIKNYKKVGLISQTTQKIELLKKAVDRLLSSTEELRVFNTICKTTSIRQKEAVELAKKVDLMLVLGGKNSSNTKKLYEVCKSVLNKSFHIESPKEIDTRWLEGVKKVGITAGASTPKEHINDVIKFLRDNSTEENNG